MASLFFLLVSYTLTFHLERLKRSHYKSERSRIFKTLWLWKCSPKFSCPYLIGRFTFSLTWALLALLISLPFYRFFPLFSLIPNPLLSGSRFSPSTRRPCLLSILIALLSSCFLLLAFESRFSTVT